MNTTSKILLSVALLFCVYPIHVSAQSESEEDGSEVSAESTKKIRAVAPNYIKYKPDFKESPLLGLI